MTPDFWHPRAILHDKVQIAKNVNATVIPLDQAP